MKRQTVQKTVILETLYRLGGHKTPNEIYEALHDKYPTISRATVFRVLSEYTEDGVTQRIGTLGATRYEYGNRPHYHVCCRICGKVADVELPYFDGLENKATAMDGFTVENHYIEFIGLCPDCAKQIGNGNGENK